MTPILSQLRYYPQPLLISNICTHKYIYICMYIYFYFYFHISYEAPVSQAMRLYLPDGRENQRSCWAQRRGLTFKSYSLGFRVYGIGLRV